MIATVGFLLSAQVGPEQDLAICVCEVAHSGDN